MKIKIQSSQNTYYKHFPFEGHSRLTENRAQGDGAPNKSERNESDTLLVKELMNKEWIERHRNGSSNY